jgi:hypothetical protein
MDQEVVLLKAFRSSDHDAQTTIVLFAQRCAARAKMQAAEVESDNAKSVASNLLDDMS